MKNTKSAGLVSCNFEAYIIGKIPARVFILIIF